jgi:hypothetical protein
MKHGELHCYRFEDKVIRPGVVIVDESGLYIVPVHAVAKKGVCPTTNIPLTFDDGVFREADAICEQVQEANEDRSIYLVSNLTSNTLEKIIDAIKIKSKYYN